MPTIIPLPIRPTDHISLQVLMSLPSGLRFDNLCIHRDDSGKNTSALVTYSELHDRKLIFATEDGRLLSNV